MRVLPAVSTLTIVVLVLLAGCDRNRSAWSGIEELTPPKKPSIRADRLGFRNTETQPTAGIRVQQRQKPADAGTNASRVRKPAADEIARQTDRTRQHWEAYRAELPAPPSAEREEPRVEAVKPEVAAPQPEPYISPAVRRRYSAEHTNLRIRIAVLESRLAYAGESEKKDLSARLEQARNELKAIDASCIAESGSVDTEPSSGGHGNGPTEQR